MTLTLKRVQVENRDESLLKNVVILVAFPPKGINTMKGKNNGRMPFTLAFLHIGWRKLFFMRQEKPEFVIFLDGKQEL